MAQPASSGMKRTAIHDGDRQLRRTCIRFGEEIRAMRLDAGISQAALARAVGISPSVICRVEQGAIDTTSRTRARVVAVLGGGFRISVYPDGAPLIHDAAHARAIESLLRTCHPSWRPRLEVPVPGPGRRSTDIRLERRDHIVLIEMETHVRSLETVIRNCTAKRDAVAEVSARDRSVHLVLALPPTRHHRALIREHPGIVASAFPRSSRDLARALAAPDGSWPGDGIPWVPASVAVRSGDRRP